MRLPRDESAMCYANLLKTKNWN